MASGCRAARAFGQRRVWKRGCVAGLLLRNQHIKTFLLDFERRDMLLHEVAVAIWIVSNEENHVGLAIEVLCFEERVNWTLELIMSVRHSMELDSNFTNLRRKNMNTRLGVPW